MKGEHHTCRVNHESRGEKICLILIADTLVAFQQHPDIRCANFIEERDNLLGGLAHIDGQHHRLILLRGEGLEGGEFAAAGFAPRSPEIDKHNPPTQAAQAHGTAIQRWQLEIGGHLPDQWMIDWRGSRTGWCWGW